MKTPKISIPWYQREIFSRPDNDDFGSKPIDFRLPKSKPNNPNPEADLSPEPAPQPQLNPSPNPSSNPSTNPNKPNIMLPLNLPSSFPQSPMGQPFPVPKGLPIADPRRKPGSKPAQTPAKPLPVPRRNPARRPLRTPAAAIDLLAPENAFPTHVPQPWEIIPVGGLTPIVRIEDSPWYAPAVGYAKDVGVDAQLFGNYIKDYDYAHFSIKGMYADLSDMFGAVAAAILIGYILASIPLGVPGVPGI